MKDFFVVYEDQNQKITRRRAGFSPPKSCRWWAEAHPTNIVLFIGIGITALFALHLPFLPQKYAAQVECQQALGCFCNY